MSRLCMVIALIMAALGSTHAYAQAAPTLLHSLYGSMIKRWKRSMKYFAPLMLIAFGLTGCTAVSTEQCLSCAVSVWKTNSRGGVIYRDIVFGRIEDVSVVANSYCSKNQLGRAEIRTSRAASMLGNPSNHEYDFVCVQQPSSEEQFNAKIASWRSECAKMGFTPNTTDFATCVLSLKELETRVEISRRSQSQYELETSRLKQKQDADANLSVMQTGLGIAAGSGRISNGGQNNSSKPAALTPPPPPLTIMTPSGNRFNCSTVGASVACR